MIELKKYPNAHKYYMQDDKTFCDEIFTAYSFTSEETGEEIYLGFRVCKDVKENETYEYVYKLNNPGKCYGKNEIWYTEPARELAIRELEQCMEKEIFDLQIGILRIKNAIYTLDLDRRLNDLENR